MMVMHGEDRKAGNGNCPYLFQAMSRYLTVMGRETSRQEGNTAHLMLTEKP
jgi:hypothetical protein